MKFMDINKYSYTTHFSVPEGTEMWFMIQAGDQLSEGYTIQVGYIQRSDITSLDILDVTHIPENLTTESTSVQINAKVISNVTVSNVQITCFIFYPNGNKGISESMVLIEDNLYSSTLSLLPPDSHIRSLEYTAGTKVFYRIKAEDESGNTMLTPAYNFTIV